MVRVRVMSTIKLGTRLHKPGAVVEVGEGVLPKLLAFGSVKLEPADEPPAATELVADLATVTEPADEPQPSSSPSTAAKARKAPSKASKE